MATVLNQDVAGLHPRINRFLVEIHKSASSNLSEMSSYDQNPTTRSIVQKVASDPIP